MKYKRKCPNCGREATKRFGRLDFCDTCHKEIRRTKADYVWKEIHYMTISDNCRIYAHVPVKVH